MNLWRKIVRSLTKPELQSLLSDPRPELKVEIQLALSHHQPCLNENLKGRRPATLPHYLQKG